MPELRLTGDDLFGDLDVQIGDCPDIAGVRPPPFGPAVPARARWPPVLSSSDRLIGRESLRTGEAA